MNHLVHTTGECVKLGATSNARYLRGTKKMAIWYAIVKIEGKSTLVERSQNCAIKWKSQI
jgi:hypothetical protein